ncbi:AhpC/TSA antioxidant enzyme domain-containing protein [Synechococcus sp. Minos11]|uniref:peroxiredoxin-like family protein n=1 Tax=Synechococcus sp. Minos11 TaxID=221341 RepID=UPI0016442627|nr:AhpC/TSA antioxidant enzyme domain-containing protein [Synechococcus sp. Minos11]
MTGNLQAIGFLFTWVLLWCLGGIGIEALLLQVGLIAPGDGSWAGGLGFLLWTLLIGFAGWALFNRITGLTQPAPTLQASPWHEVPAPLQPVLAGLAPLANQQRRLLLVLSQLGDFDSVEYAQAVMASWPQLREAGVDVRAIGIGNAGSVDRFCDYTRFPKERLSVDPEARLHRDLGLYGGAEGFGGPWGNLLAMCAGIGSPGTLREVLRSYHGGGRYLPFWIASIRLRNMVEVLSHWGTYVPDERWMTQRGATFLISSDGSLLYSWKDPGLLGFSASMAEPLKFLKTNPAA